MYLKQLELIGFKSFAERTRLDFEPGITAIVGPNGCGKTNIVDGIKWALGEQSAKSLRGSTMEDVIFHGTDDRKGIGMAEASVTFDNADKRIPLEFSEITVTRRVFRSGESQYFINKNLCRLKDVDSVFTDTGIGMRAYSVFEQGKMDLILSSRPEERRFVFEEAAGISRYKEYKRDALRKLEVTEANLVRLNDIIKEVQRQLNSIDRQAAKARRYKTVQDELKRKEILLLAYQLRDLQADLAESEKDKSFNEQQALEMRAAIEAKEKRTGELRQLLRGMEMEASVSQEEKIRVETLLVGNRHQIEYKRSKINELTARSREIDGELNGLNKDLDELRNNLLLLKNGFSNAADIKDGYKKRLDEKYSEIKALDDVAAELAGEIDSKKDLLVGKTANSSHIKNELSNIDLELKGLFLKERRDSVELAKKKRERDDLSGKLAKMKNILEGQRKSLLSLRQKIKDNEEKVLLLKDEVANINKLLVDKQQYFAEKHKEYEALSGDKRLSSILENKEEFPGVIGLVRDLVSIKEGYSNAITSCLGARTQWIVVDTLEHACHAASRLNCQAVFLVLESLPDVEALREVSNGIRAMDLVTSDPRYGRLVRFLLGRILITNPAEGGPAVDELKAVLNSTSAEILELTEKYNLSKGMLEQEEKFMESARNNLYNEEIALGVDENDFLRYRSVYDSLCEEIEVLELDSQGEIAKKEELSAERLLKENELTAVGSELKLLYSEIEMLQGSLKDADAKKAKENKEYTELKINLVSAEEKENLADFKKHQAEKQTETTEAMINKLLAEKEENLAMIERLRIEADRLENETKEIGKRSADIGGQYDALKLRRKGLEEELLLCEEGLRSERNRYEEVYSQFNERQLRLGEIKIKIDNIMQRLQNEYKTPADSIDSIRLEGVRLEVLDQEIVTLRSKLDSMGEVSLVAIEEQDELVKRHEFLSTQREDLVNSKDTLLKTIAKLNTTTKKMFWDTFCMIRENFNQIFCQLFGGGKADLILVDESNILESGIEIIARPPGKRLQNVSLLSGGEKALAALALLFSIFKVKPSPFCIMDEIDAPLDDSNIERFTELLKEFAETSQFLIVTHNKRTIAAANALYGITMQESGVSRIVSVKLTASGAAIR